MSQLSFYFYILYTIYYTIFLKYKQQYKSFLHSYFRVNILHYVFHCFSKWLAHWLKHSLYLEVYNIHEQNILYSYKMQFQLKLNVKLGKMSTFGGKTSNFECIKISGIFTFIFSLNSSVVHFKYIREIVLKFH